MSIKELITFVSRIIALAFVLMLINSNYVVVLYAQQQQHSTNIQNTNGTLSGQNKVSILPDAFSFSPNVINVKIGDTVTWTNHDIIHRVQKYSSVRQACKAFLLTANKLVQFHTG